MKKTRQRKNNAFGVFPFRVLQFCCILPIFDILPGCRVFEVQCLHIPVYDRTPFEGMSTFLEIWSPYYKTNLSISLKSLLLYAFHF